MRDTGRVVQSGLWLRAFGAGLHRVGDGEFDLDALTAAFGFGDAYPRHFRWPAAFIFFDELAEADLAGHTRQMFCRALDFKRVAGIGIEINQVGGRGDDQRPHVAIGGLFPSSGRLPGRRPGHFALPGFDERVRFGHPGIGSHDERGVDIGAAGDALFLALQPGYVGLQLDGAGVHVGRQLQRYQQNDVVLVNVGRQVVRRQLFGQRPLDGACGNASGQIPFDARRDARRGPHDLLRGDRRRRTRRHHVTQAFNATVLGEN